MSDTYLVMGGKMYDDGARRIGGREQFNAQHGRRPATPPPPSSPDTVVNAIAEGVKAGLTAALTETISREVASALAAAKKAAPATPDGAPLSDTELKAAAEQLQAERRAAGEEIDFLTAATQVLGDRASTWTSDGMRATARRRAERLAASQRPPVRHQALAEREAAVDDVELTKAALEYQAEQRNTGRDIPILEAARRVASRAKK